MQWFYLQNAIEIEKVLLYNVYVGIVPCFRKALAQTIFQKIFYKEKNYEKNLITRAYFTYGIFSNASSYGKRSSRNLLS